MSIRTALVLAAVIGLHAEARAGTPPAGFTDTEVWSGLSLPTAVAYEPGTGNLWVLEKAGSSFPMQGPRVLVRDRVSGVVSTALTLDCVDSWGERGLLGIAFAPNYLDGPDSRYVYLYYTRQITDSGTCSIPGTAASSRNRVVRYLESGGSLSGEEVLYQAPALTGSSNHNAGTLRFGNDGTLFVSMGDNDTDADANPLARDLSDPRGKILRMAADGSVPADNPFVGQPGHLPLIWAWGLRNPFRFSIDPLTGAPFIGDVGEITWEEIDVGTPGADFGYPCFEGPAAYRTCVPAPAPGSVTDPVYSYGHGSQTAPVTGRCVTGGPVYRATAFPAAHRDRYYFADWAVSWIRSAAVAGDNTLSDVQVFMPDAGPVVDMVVSPDGCLTYLSYDGAVHEVCYDCLRFDANGDDHVDGVELTWVGRAFGSCSANPAAEWWFAVDFDLDGCVGGDDLAQLAAVWACS